AASTGASSTTRPVCGTATSSASSRSASRPTTRTPTRRSRTRRRWLPTSAPRPASTRPRPTRCCAATPSTRSVATASASRPDQGEDAMSTGTPDTADGRADDDPAGAGASAGRTAEADDADLGGEVVLGSALFTLVDPHRGHEVAYNRWYERDHF